MRGAQGMRSRIRIGLLVALLLAGATGSAGAASTPEQTLEAIQQWVAGRYDSSAQVAADEAAGVPDQLKHRLMHQLFVPVPVEIPAIPGYLVFQQSSLDGSDEPGMIVRGGLLQFLVDDEAGVVRQRELNFRDLETWKNAWRTPERLQALTLDAFNVDPGCDFLLRLEDEGGRIYGPMPAGTCRIFSAGLGKELSADDAVWITPDGFWFKGRFVDETGAVMWGNASEEPVKLTRVASVPGRPRSAVLVFGGTRGTGLEVARLLAGRGTPVTVVARGGSERSALESLGVTIVEGDALRAGDVEAAFASGAYAAVVSTLGCRGCEQPPDFLGNRNVVDAAKAAGVERFILVSSVGAGDSAEAAPWITRWLLEDVLELKTMAEDYTVSSGIAYTIIRPGALKDGEASGRGQLSEDRGAMGIITRGELAVQIVACLDDERTVRQVYTAYDPGLDWPWDMF